MPPRRTFHVVPFGEKSWKLKSANRTVSNHRDKSVAIKEAQKRAKNGQPSQIVIHKRDGTIQREYTYKKDPPRFPG